MIDYIRVYTQNSIRIETEIGPVYIDPFQMQESPKDAVLILITHDHYDHYSSEDIDAVIGPCTTLVVPEKCFKKAQEKAGKVKKIETVMPGETLTVAGLTLETVPAYNILKPFHPKSNAWVGYILNTSHGRIYVAGDTDATEELKKVQCDIALIPVGGTYTMDAKKAAEAVNIMKPKVAIPVHYGTIVGKESDADTFAKLVDPDIKVEILKEY